mgnify:CR=1 FL=1
MTPSSWSYSDDGAMNIAVAESIAAAGTIDPEHLLHRFEIAQHVVHVAALATLNGKVRDLTVREPSLEDVFFGFSD